MRPERAYLDWNATTPLRPEARAAMVSAMDVVGNPSSVHGEGRAALAIVERARAEVAAAAGAMGADVIFTSSATEAAALAAAVVPELRASDVEHDCVRAVRVEAAGGVARSGAVTVPGGPYALQAANSETGVLQDLPQGVALVDAVQAFGKVSFAFDWLGADMAMLSAHKIGGPKGVGALIVRRGLDVPALIRGGGQEMGRRAGTENVIGIAGFAAAASASVADLAAGQWRRVEKLRNILENRLAESQKPIISIGNDAARLPNTSCFAAPGWRGETQVMAMDLAGFAISAGSACSSGKVKASAVLRAMGFDEETSGSAVRVSLGLETTEDDVMRFADRWLAAYDKVLAKAA